MNDTVERPFGFWTATALVVGGMIGAGIFVLPAQLAPFGATGAAAWIVAVAGALILGWVLTRLAAAYPAASGVVAVCGAALGPLPGLLVGWSYWIGIWSANAIIALTAVRYLAVFVPWVADTPVHTAVSATVAIWLITLLNLGGARGAGRFQVLTTLLKLLPLVAVVVILIGLVASGGHRINATPHAAFSAGSLTPALTLAFYALVGFESASIAAERVRDPARNVVRATMAGLVLTGALYLIVCSGIVYALPEAVAANASAPVSLFVETFWGRGAGLAVAAIAAIAAIGCLNGWVLVQGEVPLGMARAGLLPRWFGRTSRRDVPVGVLLLASLLASVLVMSNATRSAAGLLDFMLRLTAASTLWLYVGACSAALVLKVARVAAVAGLAFAAWAMWGAGLEADGWSLALMLTAIPLYWLRPRGAAVVAGPAAI
ncbi:MAG: amino acid permease [Pseudomonadota bacterium]|nr:amino acid permease [Pseudomonadota bacterium]